MAIDEADQSDSTEFDGVEEAPPGESGTPVEGSDVRVTEYTWADFMREYGYEDEVDLLYPDEQQAGLASGDEVAYTPSGEDWESVEFDPAPYLGYHPDELRDVIVDYAAPNAKFLQNKFLDFSDPETTPVVKDIWTWEHFKQLYYYDEEGEPPRDNEGNVIPFDPTEYLNFEPENVENELSHAEDIASELAEVVDERTVNVQEELDEDQFFSTEDGHTTVSNRYDLEKAVPMDKKTHFREEERYWVNKPYSFVIVFHSEKENEKKYYAVEPYMNEIEDQLQQFLTGKLRASIKYSDEELTVEGSEEDRRQVIEDETKELLSRYDLFSKSAGESGQGILSSMMNMFGEGNSAPEESGQLDGIKVRPEPIILEEDPDTLNEYQVEKLLYRLKRNFIGYERIDPIKHDINVEDISCDGYNSPVFVYHSEYEQIITNIYHGKDELDDFVVKLAQRSGKGISKRRPQVDATLPDGSRAQLTLGAEVSAHGTNYTIRQFKDVPFTPIDLINWNTFSLDEMAFLWLCIENNKSLIFAGGTASGKTTSLNAVSLFIPSNTKIVSIEDTREVELPQRNWIASVTRPSFSEDSQGDVDEFDLLEAALRQRPDYIVMGEVRGEEGRDLFQVMSTGHTSYSTFHADTVGEVLKRFTTDPINVSKTMFTALDLVSIQTQTRVDGNKVRRNKNLTEINHYDAENDEINVQDVYQWQAETDEFLKMGDSNTLEEIKFDRGWGEERLQSELFKRRVILAYLIKNGLNEYRQVAATIQAYINDPQTVLTLIANGQLEDRLADLREMESVLIDVDPEKEELVPRPDAPPEIDNEATDILEHAEESLFEEYRGQAISGLQTAVSEMESSAADQPEVGSEDDDFGGAVGGEVDEDFGTDDEFSFGGAEGEEDVAAEGPDWLSDDDDAGFDFGDEEGDAATAADAEPAADAAAAGTDQPQLESGADAGGASTDDGGSDPDAGAAPDRPSELEAGEETTVDAPELEAGADDDGEAAGALDDATESVDAAGELPEEDDEPIFEDPGDDEESGFFEDEDGGDAGTDDLFSEETSASGGGMFGTGGDTTAEDLEKEAEGLFGGESGEAGDPAQGDATESDSASEPDAATEDAASPDEPVPAEEPDEASEAESDAPGDPGSDSADDASDGATPPTDDSMFDDADDDESVFGESDDADSTDAVEESDSADTVEDADSADTVDDDSTDTVADSPSGGSESDATDGSVFDDETDDDAGGGDTDDGSVFSEPDDGDDEDADDGGGIFSEPDDDEEDDDGSIFGGDDDTDDNGE